MEYLTEKITNILMDYLNSLDSIEDIDSNQVKYLIESTQDEFDLNNSYE